MVEADSYAVTCHKCQVPFDVLQAAWCSCLASDRSFVCPSCGSCFCKAPGSYKQRLWAGAPKALWDRKLEEKNQVFKLPENPHPRDVRRPLVMVVEDENDILRIAVRVLDALGYGIVLARNGVDGLEMARRYKPELVLTDALMPKLDGREMARQLKSDPETAQIKIVVMTALYTSVKYEQEAYKTFKVDGYLSKPLDVDQLRAVLEKHLSAPPQVSQA